MTHSNVNPIPAGMHALTPHLICTNANEAIEFYKKAFNAVELSRLLDKDGKVMNAMLRIGNSAMMVMDEYPQWKAFGPKTLKGSPVTIHLQVEDVDAVFKQAMEAGITALMPMTDMFTET